MYYKLSIEAFSQKILYNFYSELITYLNSKFYLNNEHKKEYFFFKSNIFFLQKHIKKYTLNKSPHVNKKAREQFETRIYKAIILLKIKNLIILEKIEFFYIFYFLKKFINNFLHSGLIKLRLKLIKKKKNSLCIKEKNNIDKIISYMKLNKDYFRLLIINIMYKKKIILEDKNTNLYKLVLDIKNKNKILLKNKKRKLKIL